MRIFNLQLWSSILLISSSQHCIAAPTSGGPSLDAFHLILEAGLVVKLVLLLLLIASVLSWAIIVMKYKTLKAAKNDSQAFLNMFWYAQNLEEVHEKAEQFKQAPVAQVFKAGYKELKKLAQLEMKSDQMRAEGLQNVSRSLQRTTMVEISNLESAVQFLATIGSAGPFVGLFGTVWGIMHSFQGIGATGAANLAVVAPGISEALIATAIGLAAAIPAVIAYNFFVGRIKAVAMQIDTFNQDFLNIVQRSFMKVQ